jgi:tetratricopeptide (TPR) repeat protein
LGARLLASQKRYAESFQRIVGLFNPGPTDPDLRARLQLTAATRLEEMGAALIGEGNKPEAERFFAQAETYLQGPKGMESRFVPARIRFFIQHGRNEEAIAELERFSKNGDAANLDAACIAVCAQPTSDARLSERLERLLLKVGEERAIGGAWLALAELRGQSGRHDEEEQSYRRALALDPNHVVALNNLSYLLALRKKDLPEALAFINRAIAKAGPRAALLDTRAVVEIASGHNTQALADVGKAVADEPGPQNLFHDAQVRLVSGEEGAASASWQKARKSGLTAADFHPLELGIYKALEAQLDARR